MKLDAKSILIMILLVSTLFFGYSWFFSDNKESKERVKQLEKEFKQLEKEKKLVDLEIIAWRSSYDSLVVLDKKIQAEIDRQEAITRKAEIEAQRSKANFDKLRLEIEKTKREIEEFRKNPPNRTGDALLESLKNKTKKQ